MRKLKINTHDTHIELWQDNPKDPTLRTEIFDKLCTLLKRNGWKVTADPKVLKHYRCISKDHRRAEKGNMRCKLHITGRAIQLDVWSEASPQDNRNGREYDFNKLSRMPYLDRMRYEQLFRQIINFLRPIAELEGPIDRIPNLFRSQGADERMNEMFANDWHADKVLGYPVPRQKHDWTSRDGQRIERGQLVWYLDSKGRLRRGNAFYKGGSQWLIRENAMTLVHVSTHRILCMHPSDPKKKLNDDLRRSRLEQELAKAVRCMDFLRAQILKEKLFGKNEVYMIWARDKEAYYAPLGQGYTSDTTFAGKFTFDEAMQEISRVPHELEMIAPDGRRIKGDKLMPAA